MTQDELYPVGIKKHPYLLPSSSKELDIMAPTAFSSPRRVLGRAASPPTWAWYEQIPYDDESDTESSEEEDGDDVDDNEDDGDDVDHTEECGNHERVSANESSDNDHVVIPAHNDSGNGNAAAATDDMDIDVGDVAPSKDIKGKQRAVDPIPISQPPPPSPARHRPKRMTKEPTTHVLRPILTIHRSQGFVWNQDLFVPPYMKDRYVASTSPPNASGFSSSVSSHHGTPMTDYEPVEIVEIKVNKEDLDSIIP